MPVRRAVVLGWVGVVAAGCAGGRPPPPGPSPAPAVEVRTALDLAVALLEAKDHAGFVERFLPPARREGPVYEGQTPEALAAARLADPDPLLTRLRLARAAEPAFSDGGRTAVFAAGPGRVTFRRAGGTWYLEWE